MTEAALAAARVLVVDDLREVAVDARYEGVHPERALEGVAGAVLVADAEARAALGGGDVGLLRIVLRGELEQRQRALRIAELEVDLAEPARELWIAAGVRVGAARLLVLLGGGAGVPDAPASSAPAGGYHLPSLASHQPGAGAASSSPWLAWL